jgi:hypothetical protein
MNESTPKSPFDRMRRDEEYGGYCKKLVHGNGKVDFRILAESREELENLLPTALKFWRGRVRWFKAFRDYAASELLSQLNENLDDGEDDSPVVSASQLAKLLAAPFSVVVGQDDDGRIYFEMSGGKGRVLRGNCLEVSGTLEEGITDGDVVDLF